MGQCRDEKPCDNSLCLPMTELIAGGNGWVFLSSRIHVIYANNTL